MALGPLRGVLAGWLRLDATTISAVIYQRQAACECPSGAPRQLWGGQSSTTCKPCCWAVVGIFIRGRDPCRWSPRT